MPSQLNYSILALILEFPPFYFPEFSSSFLRHSSAAQAAKKSSAFQNFIFFLLQSFFHFSRRFHESKKVKRLFFKSWKNQEQSSRKPFTDSSFPQILKTIVKKALQLLESGFNRRMLFCFFRLIYDNQTRGSRIFCSIIEFCDLFWLFFFFSNCICEAFFDCWEGSGAN